MPLRRWTQRVPTRSTSLLRRDAYWLVAMGVLLASLSLGCGAAALARGKGHELIGGLVFLALVAAGSIALGLSHLRWLRTVGGAQVRFRAPHAFELTDDTIEFPGHYPQAPESWALERTHVQVERWWGTPTLVFSHPERRPRRFVARVLVDSPDGLAALVERRQAERETASEPQEASEPEPAHHA